ncbi:MAG: sensor histidine kinase [Acidimicrobiales bacterium]
MAVAVFALFVVMPLLLAVVLSAAVSGWVSALLALIFWLALITIAALVVVAAGRMLWPVRSLVEATGRLADGDYEARLPPAPSAPLRPVVESFNRMAERLQTAETSRRRLIADVGHELRTPLTLVRGELEAMVDGVHTYDESRVRNLLGDLAVMERLLDDLQTMSRAEAGMLVVHRELVDLVELTTDAVERFDTEASIAGIALSVDGPADGEPIDVDVDPVRMQEVVSNLVRNALRATPAGGRVEVTIRREPSVAIDVTDTGRGIPGPELGRVFDRFHSGPESDGSGLGLTISRDLVEAHGGSVEVTSVEGEGTTIRVVLDPG